MRLFIFVCFCFVNLVSYAAVQEIKDTEGEIVRYEVTVKLLPEEYKAMTVDCYSVEEWIINAAKNKARQMIDELVTESGQGSEKTNLTIKRQIVRNLTVKTAKEKTAEFEAKHKEMSK